jgi:hypothetical protein
MPHLGQPRHWQLLLLLDDGSGGFFNSWLLESTVFGGKLLLNLLLLIVDLLGCFQWFRVFCLDAHLLITRLYWLFHIESFFEILFYYLNYFLF